jgi:hypothetical protein
MTKILSRDSANRHCPDATAAAEAVAGNGVPSVLGMGHRPMESSDEGYPIRQAKSPACPGLVVEQGAGLPVGSVAEKPEGRSGGARVLDNSGYCRRAPSKGRGLHCPSPVTSTWLHTNPPAATPFFIARNEGSSMVPDNYSCIHRMKYD